MRPGALRVLLIHDREDRSLRPLPILMAMLVVFLYGTREAPPDICITSRGSGEDSCYPARFALNYIKLLPEKDKKLPEKQVYRCLRDHWSPALAII